MEQVMLDELKYPTGKFKKPETFTAQELNDRIKILEEFPALLRKEVTGITEAELEYLHRPEGWTVREIVHHLADSHVNAFIRTKLTLTEDNPAIKPYKEALWAKLPDSYTMPIESSLKILEGIHDRFTALLKTLNSTEMERTCFHSEYQRQFTVSHFVFLYSWHCGHHLAHIKNARKHKNKF